MKCSLFFVFLFFLYLKWLIIRVDVKKFKKIFVKCLQISKFCVPLQPQSREMRIIKRNFGALVQLVRIHACHAWGHGFESRTHRNKH